MSVLDIATNIIKFEEGWRERPYYCSAGYPTIGYGFKIGDKGAPLPDFRISRQVGDVWLRDLIQQIVKSIRAMYPDAGEYRQAVIISMIYQLGITGFSRFEKTIQFIEEGNYSKAASEMLNSKWARKDSPARATRQAQVFARNSIQGVYSESSN